MTHSEHNYKGYIIKLSYGFCRGGKWFIAKSVHGKYFVLKNRSYTFIKPENAIMEASNWIDEHEQELIDKLKIVFAEFCQKVANNPTGYSKPIDADYFVRMNKKLTV